ncbi:tpr-like protein [Stemphylium lycopersici]|uniref:Tpr-like protein n=1 Tax=Stemphylium lycopersici TaxID=183478 RepID=A0A364N5J2_STELY|nr:tpr-like protein [Stemphylium lycopersici]
MSTKTALKAAKAAIGAKDWEEAKNQATSVIEKDANNYFAHLFLGRANDGLGLFEDAARAYYDATKIKPDDPQAWLGLRGMYEGLKGAKVEENIDVGLALAQIYMNLDDAHKSQSAINKLVDQARAHGSKTQYARALSTQLPSSPVYSYLEGRLPDPSKTYTRIAEIHETQEASTIKRLIDERRLRIGATLEGTTAAVKNEVYAASPLEGIYEEIINWTRDDELRREYEEKLLARAYDTLMVLPAGEKADKREKVMKLAHDMVVIKHPNLLAWTIELEWRSGMEVEAF